jgi:Sulfotransferase domain/EF hand
MTPTPTPKVFVLSLHRSGTQSIHHLFLQAGLNSIHGVPLVVDGVDVSARIIGQEQDIGFIAETLDPIFRLADAASDLPVPVLYRELERRYPDALFIVVRRRAEEWVRSVRANLGQSLLPVDARILYYQYVAGRPARLSDVSDDELMQMHREHHERIVVHFRGNPNFAMFELEDPKLGERICAFLGLPPISFPYVNSGPIILAMAQLRSSRSQLFRQLCVQILRKAFGAPPLRTDCPGELPEVIAEYDAFRNSPSRLFRQFCSQIVRKSPSKGNPGGVLSPVLLRGAIPLFGSGLNRLFAIVLLGAVVMIVAEKLGADALIRQLDDDHDGMISREELNAATGGRLRYVVCKLFQAADKNHDGKLDRDELSRSEESLFWFFLHRSKADGSRV